MRESERVSVKESESARERSRFVPVNRRIRGRRQIKPKERSSRSRCPAEVCMETIRQFPSRHVSTVRMHTRQPARREGSHEGTRVRDGTDRKVHTQREQETEQETTDKIICTHTYMHIYLYREREREKERERKGEKEKVKQELCEGSPE